MDASRRLVSLCAASHAVLRRHQIWLGQRLGKLNLSRYILHIALRNWLTTRLLWFSFVVNVCMTFYNVLYNSDKLPLSIHKVNKTFIGFGSKTPHKFSYWFIIFEYRVIFDFALPELLYLLLLLVLLHAGSVPNLVPYLWYVFCSPVAGLVSVVSIGRTFFCKSLHRLNLKYF